MTIKNRVLVLGGAGLAALAITLSSCNEIPNQDCLNPGHCTVDLRGFPDYPHRQNPCQGSNGPKLKTIPPQEVYRGEELAVNLGLKPGEEAYLNKAPQGMVLDAKGNIAWSACGNSDEGAVEKVEVAVLDECGASTASFDITVKPRDTPVYINPLDQVQLVVGDSAQVPVIATPQNPGVPVSLDGGSVEGVTLEGNTVLVKPFYTLNGNVKLIANDGCLIERQPLPLIVTPRLVNGVSYDYFRRLNVHNLNNPADVQNSFVLVRQVGTGLPNKDIGNLVSIIEKSLSGNYTWLGSDAVSWEKPVLVHLGDEGAGNTCHFPGDLGEYLPGHICILKAETEEELAETTSHEGVHAYSGHRIPDIIYFGQYGEVQQSLAYPISLVVGRNLQGFGDIGIKYPYLRDRQGIKFILDLNEATGYDIPDMKRFFAIVNKMTGNGLTKLTIPQIKCIFDKQVSEITGQQTDTSPVFCAAGNFYCSDVFPYSIYGNVPRQYCGDTIPEP